MQFAVSSFQLVWVAHGSRQCHHSRPRRDAPCNLPPPRSDYSGLPVDAGSVPIPAPARTPCAIRRPLVPTNLGCPWKPAVSPFSPPSGRPEKFSFPHWGCPSVSPPPPSPGRLVQFAASSFRLVWVASGSRQCPDSRLRREAPCNSPPRHSSSFGLLVKGVSVPIAAFPPPSAIRRLCVPLHLVSPQRLHQDT